MSPNPSTIRHDSSAVVLVPTAVGCCPPAAHAASLIFGGPQSGRPQASYLLHDLAAATSPFSTRQ
jgi:hypothetical protein